MPSKNLLFKKRFPSNAGKPLSKFSAYKYSMEAGIAGLFQQAARRVLGMAQFARQDAEETEDDVYQYGACLYRVGQYEEAVEVLSTYEKLLDPDGDAFDRHALACAKYFLALARKALGHDTQAQRLLHEANELSEKTPDRFFRFNRRVEMEVLREEATAAVAE